MNINYSALFRSCLLVNLHKALFHGDISTTNFAKCYLDNAVANAYKM